ncbi:MAG TPA: phosphotransferase [Gammaproteobacteria bacterium]|nr:phosphotransferase [Gammaproteobacteria bacterium]
MRYDIRQARAVSLSEKVAFLRRPDIYPDLPQTVQAIETHMSWVFLTERFAYKLKKPVSYSFLDFGTQQARALFCAEEVRLNRRLAPDIYLGVSRLGVDDSGALTLDSDASTVETLVRMKRLPGERMMDRLIVVQQLSRSEADRVGETLAHFYAGLPAEPVGAARYLARFEQRIEEDAAAVMHPWQTPSAVALTALFERQLRYLARRRALFELRIHEGRVVEGHGDLRPEHVCLDGAPRIIDCLEFNRELRIVDPVEELAFLSLECERAGAAWVEAALFAAHARIGGDAAPPDLIAFHKVRRACTRARLCAWHVGEPGPRGVEHWLRRTRDYLEFAASYSRRL